MVACCARGRVCWVLRLARRTTGIAKISVSLVAASSRYSETVPDPATDPAIPADPATDHADAAGLAGHPGSPSESEPADHAEAEIEFRSEMTVELVRASASDVDVLFAARVSTLGEQTLGAARSHEEASARDAGLINYLMRDRHGSPFEHNSMTFYVQAPIFVFREFMRHRIASYNEESGRYRELRPVFYVPGDDRALVQVGKTGHYDFVPGTPEQSALVQAEARAAATAAYASYQRILASGVAREVARIVLPLSIYSSMYVTMNARSLMNFLSLRTKREGSHFPSFPQREIEMVAEQMEAHWAGLMPMTHAAFNDNGRVQP
jgi:thymidylate synthase (FAD)